MSVEVTAKQIQDLRSAFLKDLESKGESSVHPDDLERVKSGDEWLRRFLLHHDAAEKEALAMLWEAVLWRKEFKTNEINDTNVNVDFLKEGVLFAHGKDKDGCTLFIFKCKKHQKGQKDFEDIKRCVIYWLERLERQEKGKPVTIFFDMEGCGVSNVDMELIKYIIHVFKQYYPFFLNYIIILEMAWILNAVFKVIKTMLPEKAVQKIKFVKKNDLNQFVDPDQALKCWGGNDNYSFVFVPEAEENAVVNNSITPSNKKVHFADGSPMSDSNTGFGDSKEQGDGGILKVQPSNIITFAKEGNELVGTLELHNTDNQINISYKMKTTSPEKFRVRPSLGCLAPGGRATVSVTLLPGFQLGGLSRDKFLVMSMPVDIVELSPQELAELWKNPTNKNVSQHRLSCAQSGDLAKNGSVIATGATMETEQNQISQLSNRLTQLIECQSQLHTSVKRTQTLQWITMFIVIVLSFITIWVLKHSAHDNSSSQFCYKNEEVANTSP
ncbi:hypothetical protein ILUMI_07727 [Ignelater luminosus]|uniref:Motile sperm domain-containing protein 2 n=1 Tax=Ignelater luminosus TaxID=2038154 RepID=A0A8K0D3B7_IGNLU|nr:hypothetical protein ILUMI_07727 [Ignelater luminosus]